jgi:hypothetical protein
MSELLHAWSLAPAAIGTCCVAADRARGRRAELAASAVMLLAMLDAAGGQPVLPPVLWTALLLAAAMGLAVIRRPRSARSRLGGSRRASVMHLHTTIGLVLMAALVLGMPSADVDGAHVHGGVGVGAFVVGLAAASGAYLAASALLALRAHPWRDRAQLGAMGASAALMALATIV